MHIIAIGQQKGGVGKSALAINLACQAVAGGKAAAAVDMDAEQGTAARWGSRRASWRWLCSQQTPALLAVNWRGCEPPARHGPSSICPAGARRSPPPA